MKFVAEPEAFNVKRKGEMTMDKEIKAILDYYGGSFDDSGEPDEAPEAEGVATLPTPEEKKEALRDWNRKVKGWEKAGGEKL